LVSRYELPVARLPREIFPAVTLPLSIKCRYRLHFIEGYGTFLQKTSFL
jgi:hypothetical protein